MNPPYSAQQRRALIAAVIGNALEWYDFVVYAFFAATIGRLFFPSSDETASLLAAFATFGAGFVVRPLGAVVLGSYADRAGRKRVLMITMLLMGVGTAMIGLAPTYSTIGGWAPFIIVSARLIQGFSAGAGLGSATAFMMEHSSENRRGLTASWQQSSQAATLLAASLLAAALSAALSPMQLDKWGWRLPFLLGPLIIVPAGLYIRNHVLETPAFAKLEMQSLPSPLADLLQKHGRQVIAGLGLVIVWTVSMYFFLVYMPTYAVRQLHLPQSSALFANSIALAALTILAPLFGRLSDSIGRKPLLIAGAAGMSLLSVPLVAAVAAHPSVRMLIAVQFAMAVLIAIFTGPAPAALGELYPTSIRSSGMSIAYNGAVTIFGGFAPFISTWLVAKTGNNLAPVGYVVLAALLSSIALASMRETAYDRLAERSDVAAAQRRGVSP